MHVCVCVVYVYVYVYVFTSDMQRRSSRVVEQAKRQRATSDHDDEVGESKGDEERIQSELHIVVI